MPKLQINFGAGCKDTRVISEIDNEPVENRILNTDYSTGFSFGKTYELDTHSTLLEIKLPALKLAESIDLELVQDTYVNIDLTPDGQLNAISTHDSATYF